MATGPVVTQEYPSGWKPSQEDKLILQQPYAEAVSFMSQRSDLVVYAVKMLENQQKVIEVARLLDEVENLQRLEQEGKALPPLNAKSSSIKRQRLGSNGEQESEPEASREGDLETDGEPLVMQNKAQEMLLPEVAAKEDVQRKDALKQNTLNKDAEKKDNAALRRKLRALRHENQLLKARQLCRGCGHRPVSITFLPCGHYSYCYDCGQKFGACPICKKTILADVRTFLA